MHKSRHSAKTVEIVVNHATGSPMSSGFTPFERIDSWDVLLLLVCFNFCGNLSDITLFRIVFSKENPTIYFLHDGIDFVIQHMILKSSLFVATSALLASPISFPIVPLRVCSGICFGKKLEGVTLAPTHNKNTNLQFLASILHSELGSCQRKSGFNRFV